MSDLVNIISSCSSETFLNEDRNVLRIELSSGALIEDILKFEKHNGIILPGDLRNLLLFSNGLNFLGLSILSLEEIEVFTNSGMISFHSWGNGDFDCLSTGENYPQGTVIFMLHSEEETYVVSDRLTTWFKAVISEIKMNLTLLHPLDYQSGKSEGMYKSIGSKIQK